MVTTIAKRLCFSQINKPPMSLSHVYSTLRENEIAVVVAKITNDDRFLEVPKMTICALGFTATARARLEKAGGRCMTFDQLLIENPTC